MGYNLGRWEGDTLVIEVSGLMEDTWLDSAGNFHGPSMKVPGALHAAWVRTC